VDTGDRNSSIISSGLLSFFSISPSAGRVAPTRTTYREEPVGIPVQNYVSTRFELDAQLPIPSCASCEGSSLHHDRFQGIQEYFFRLSHALALFKIKRDDSKSETTMEYLLDLDRSYFKLEELMARISSSPIP